MVVLEPIIKSLDINHRFDPRGINITLADMSQLL